MKMNFKEIGKTALNLVIFCFVVGFLLSFYNQMTKDKILANQRKEVEEVRLKLLPADKYKPVEGMPNVVKAYKSGKFIGYIVKAVSTGYSSKIVIMYSVSPDFKIMGVNIVSQQETPGLGTRIEEDVKLKQFGNKPFVAQFVGKGLSALHIGTSKTFNKDSIAAITGTTISSRAVTKGIRESLKELIDRLKAKEGEGKPSKGKRNQGVLEGCIFASEDLPIKLRSLLPAEKYERLYSGAYKAIKGGKVVGYLVKSYAKGYESNIVVGMAVKPNFEIAHLIILHQEETPGFGEKICKASFLKQFVGKSVESLVLKREGVPSNDYVVAVTGATVSCRAVVKAAKNGILKLKAYLKGCGK